MPSAVRTAIRSNRIPRRRSRSRKRKNTYRNESTKIVSDSDLETPRVSGRAGPMAADSAKPQTEADRILSVYKSRHCDTGPDRYGAFQLDALYALQERERRAIHAMKQHGIFNLSACKILDVGCGYGPWLRDFIQWGARPENLFGIDLIPDRVEVARQLCPPQVTVVAGNGADLPWDDGAFDILVQSTVFTSILDAAVKQRLAQEMLRVLKPGGLILWLDFRLNNFRNPNVRGIGKREIRQLFRGCAIRLWPTNLLPPLARALAPWSLLLVELLGRIPILCSHYLACIQKPLAPPLNPGRRLDSP